MGYFLQQKVQRKRQQCRIFFFLTVPGDEQQQEYHYEIPGVQILGQQRM